MSKTCFVVSPIGNEGSDIRTHADNLLNYVLSPVCKVNDISLVRADEITTTTQITADIYKHLSSDELAIVDITYQNPNVFLELGYRIAKNLPFIIIKDKDVKESFPFDISGIRILEYSLKLQNLEKSKELLDKFIKSVDYTSLETVNILEPVPGKPGIAVTREGNGYISFSATEPLK